MKVKEHAILRVGLTKTLGRIDKFISNLPPTIRVLVFLATSTYAVIKFVFEDSPRIYYHFVDPRTEINVEFDTNEFPPSVRGPRAGKYSLLVVRVHNPSAVDVPARRLSLKYDKSEGGIDAYEGTEYTVDALPSGGVSREFNYEIVPPREGLDTLVFRIRGFGGDSTVSKTLLCPFVVKGRE